MYGIDGHLPVVLGQAVSLLHGSPVLPLFFCLVYRSSPNLLSPDDVLEVESTTVLHAPLGNLFSGKCSRLMLSVSRKNTWKIRDKLTPPPSEHIKSVARPQQWSELPGQEQSLLHPISLILPGNAATTFLAALTETALQAPTAGIVGAEYPPKPVAADEQHFI